MMDKKVYSDKLSFFGLEQSRNPSLIVEQKTVVINDSNEKEHIEPKIQVQELVVNESVKAEFQRILSETRKQSQAREKADKESVKIKNDDWDFDR